MRLNSIYGLTMKSLHIAILTISDSREIANDTSGQFLVTAATTASHIVSDRKIVKDNRYQIRATLSNWLISDTVDVIICNGGTGLTGHDGTPEAIEPLFDKKIDGFGELFRFFSIEQIGAATVQSRATAGVANGKYIFCLPGSTSACELAWEKILLSQLNSSTKPCNFANLIPRLKE